MTSSIPTDISDEFPEYVREIQQIGAVEQILETIAAITGLGFVAVAHVTEHSWTTCAVLDKLGFGLKVGEGLEVTTTLCEEVRATSSMIVIDHVREDEQYRDHHTPRIYGFQSYFSIPIFRPDGAYFGTLCGLDPTPATLSAPATKSTLQLFAQLISKQLEAERIHSALRNELMTERQTAELREQFIAVLGHDLRTPLGAVQSGIDLLRMKHPDPASIPVLQRIKRSLDRVNSLVDDVVDFTRGRMGGGITLNMRYESDLTVTFGQVIDELRDLHPEHLVMAQMSPNLSLLCDAGRLSQLLSNLVKNAIVHGDAGAPISVAIGTQDGRFTITVSNRGNALPPELVAQLFKPFWRASSGSAYEGLGLGLYIVSEIARSHGGSMDVASQNGMVAFTFSMPDHSRIPMRTLV